MGGRPGENELHPPRRTISKSGTNEGGIEEVEVTDAIDSVLLDDAKPAASPGSIAARPRELRSKDDVTSFGGELEPKRFNGGREIDNPTSWDLHVDDRPRPVQQQEAPGNDGRRWFKPWGKNKPVAGSQIDNGVTTVETTHVG